MQGTLFSVSFWLSLSGGLLACLAMIIAYKSKAFSIYGVSILGASFHNIGQVIAITWIYQQYFMQLFLPILLALSIVSGILMVFMPTISTFAIAELLTMNNIKLFGTTIQENINNSMWNYGAALSLIMLFLIGATTLLASDDKDHNEGGGLW